MDANSAETKSSFLSKRIPHPTNYNPKVHKITTTLSSPHFGRYFHNIRDPATLQWITVHDTPELTPQQQLALKQEMETMGVKRVSNSQKSKSHQAEKTSKRQTGSQSKSHQVSVACLFYPGGHGPPKQLVLKATSEADHFTLCWPDHDNDKQQLERWTGSSEWKALEHGLDVFMEGTPLVYRVKGAIVKDELLQSLFFHGPAPFQIKTEPPSPPSLPRAFVEKYSYEAKPSGSMPSQASSSGAKRKRQSSPPSSTIASSPIQDVVKRRQSTVGKVPKQQKMFGDSEVIDLCNE